MENRDLKNKVVVIGAGPIGITAAAQLIERGLSPVVLERGPTVGHAVLEWGHVSLFTPWPYVTNRAVTDLLAGTGWSEPAPGDLPTGRDVVERYLMPAAATPALKDRIVYNADVAAISKKGHSKICSRGRDEAPFSVQYTSVDGTEHIVEAGAVIDTSGTWFTPNPIGVNGLPVAGEAVSRDNIAYGIPDVMGSDRADYADRTTLVLGSGHSAVNVVLDLLRLKKTHPETTVHLGLRTDNIKKIIGGGDRDDLPGSGRTGQCREAGDGRRRTGCFDGDACPAHRAIRLPTERGSRHGRHGEKR